MKNFFIIIFILFSIISTTFKAFAASVDVSSPMSVKVGDNFLVTITTNTDEESINSLDIQLNYDTKLLTFIGYKTEGSMVNLWIEPPHQEKDIVSMSGIIPGGVSGIYDANKKGLESIPLTQLIFTAVKPGIANFSFSKSVILKNDGTGTELTHTESKAQVLIKNNIDTNKDEINSPNSTDKTPPNEFLIQFINSSLFSKTPSMLLFKAEDIDSGIKEYKMKDGIHNWIKTKNPQPINRHIFSRKVSIRAIDFAGNFRDESIIITGYISIDLFLLIILLFLVGLYSYKLLKYKL